MKNDIATHYSGSGNLASLIRDVLSTVGKDVARLSTQDLATIDEFHIRGRQATLELADCMELTPDSHVLDMGSGLGGPARTLAETYGCRVTGIDLTQSFCEAANEISGWLNLSDKVRFVHGDATNMPFAPDSFDAAMTIHAAMNVPDKRALYANAKKVLKPGHIFAVYDVLQGEGGPVYFPVPWARDPSISYLASPAEMREMLMDASFEIVDEIDSTETSLIWFREMAERMADSGPPPLFFHLFLGADTPEMVRNQIRNMAEKRIRTVTYICRA